ncbi:hypothetical protein [Herbidospora cretacea]|uniref:hypothetical protein n=1 Tax=Herbidospora cretacea TaxID=28444 RepID=UPI0006903DEF|nr:hypothetical protein [Herbidospora cretacea]
MVAVAALAEVLFGFRFADVHAPWRALFAGFDPAELTGLGYEERIVVTYDRLRAVDRGAGGGACWRPSGGSPRGKCA